jgi:hypothetical protein
MKVTFQSFCAVFDRLIHYNIDISDAIKIEYKNESYRDYKEDPMKGKTPELWMEWFFEDLNHESTIMLKSKNK